MTLTAISPGLSPLSGNDHDVTDERSKFTFTALMLDIPGGYVIQAKSGKLKGRQTNSFTVTKAEPDPLHLISIPMIAGVPAAFLVAAAGFGAGSEASNRHIGTLSRRRRPRSSTAATDG